MNGSAFVFDLETTGVDINSCHPCQICLVYSDGSSAAPRILMNTYVNPMMPIEEGAAKVHGITDEMAKTGPDYAFTAWQSNLLFNSMAPEYLIGFNSKYFDEPILNRCLGSEVFPGIKHIDVLDVLYRFFPELPSHKLENAYKTFFNRPLTGAHDASVDVLATLELLTQMRTRIGMTMPQLYEDMRTPKIYSIVPIGKHKGKTPQEVETGWARWMQKNATDMRPDLQLTVDFIAGGCRVQ